MWAPLPPPADGCAETVPFVLAGIYQRCLSSHLLVIADSVSVLHNLGPDGGGKAQH